jgi:hypothetical protein
VGGEELLSQASWHKVSRTHGTHVSYMCLNLSSQASY